MPLVNGKIVEKKPFSVIALVYAVLNYVTLFVASILPSSVTIAQRVDRFNDARRPGYTGEGGSGDGGNIRGVDHRTPVNSGGCSGGGCG